MQILQEQKRCKARIAEEQNPIEQPQETPKIETQGQPEIQEKKTPYFVYAITVLVLAVAAYALSINEKKKSRCLNI